ncbi:hypothetical protein QYE76_028545 [Lolium multiflorum]|uniref:CCHC-type domain-containing protein n=1 Tax=Lolium multiflorum TaxID=4521 RepID=A0AAD8QNW0_LOLMU|nr:hypothetical protein QYE76_028545 [Lolium multiflorum]
MENELRARGIRPGTEGWDPRAKSWWYGHGGSLNPETGECVYRGKIIKPTEKLIEAMRDAQEGKIKFNRENDALTKALGNPEHGGRVRGMGHIPWKIGFPQNDDPYGYRSRKRKMDRDADVVARLASEMDVMKKTVSVLVAERDASRAQHEDHPMDLGSQQRRSSVASTEAPPAGAPTIEITAPEPLVVEITAPEPPRYPVDDIKEMKACHLYYPIGNMSMKVAIGSALPPGALHHNNPIPDGYARVTVEDIVQGRGAKANKSTPLRWWWRRRWWWWFTYTSFTSADAVPQFTSGGAPPPSPRPAGDQTPPPNPPPAKKQRQSWVINPEPYVPATTKIPEPSLKPLTPRPWELSVEQNAAVVAAQHEKWQADCKKKREPEPKQVFSEKEKSWAKSFLNTPSQAAKNLPDDYERELRSQALAVGGKQVAQLGEQSKQSIAPLIVKAAGPEDDAPDVIAAAAAQGLTVARAKEQAADLGLTLRAALGLDDVAMKDVVFAYVKDGPLVEPAQEEDLPRQMKGLLNCELFQLFNLRELDKSIISCYVLMKKREMRIRHTHDVGFIDPQIVNSYVLEHHPKDVEDDLWRFLTKQELKSDILFPYHFGYQEETSIARGEEQLDVKMDVKLDKELDMKISHGRAREEREECARGEEEVQAGPARDNKIVNQENKNSADIITWREYEALRNEMRREFRTKDDELKGTVDEIKQTLDATNVTVTGLADQMTDIQRNIADMRLAIENLTAQQQQQQDDEDPELEDDAHNARGAPRGHRPRGWVPLGRNGRGQDEEDGLGKPKFSIPKFEGGADVEEYLTWELKIEKLWSLHPHYSEDRKIKLASSEFDGYALRWWDSLVRNLDEDGAQPIRTWRAMKEAMTSRFVPTNYMRNIFDKLTLLRQGVKTVDEYYMEMEMLMQRGRVRESLEMTMQRFLNGLKYDVKGIVRHYTYTNMNQLLHHAREAESQLAEEAKVKGRATGAGRFTPRAPSTAPAPSTRSAPYSTPPSKPVSNVSNAKKSESAASTSGSSMSTARNRDMLCHTCGGKGHFKRDCPNRKVMFINEDNEYETGDDVDPNAPDDDDYDTDGEDAYPSDARTIVVSQRALNVLPSASTQRCNLFQTKALVGPDKACKVIIDGGSCRNLASKELCTKLKLKYLPHPHPYYIQWLSDNGEMKEFGDVFPEEVPAGLPPLRDDIQLDHIKREMNHIATAEPSAPGVNYSLLIMAVKMAVETAVEMTPGAPVPQGAGTETSVPRIGVSRCGGAPGCFLEFREEVSKF